LNGKVEKTRTTLKGKKLNKFTSSSFAVQAMKGLPVGAEEWLEGMPGSGSMVKEEFDGMGGVSVKEELSDEDEITVKKEPKDVEEVTVKVEENLEDGWSTFT
jgi:hypothetical protein